MSNIALYKPKLCFYSAQYLLFRLGNSTALFPPELRKIIVPKPVNFVLNAWDAASSWMKICLINNDKVSGVRVSGTNSSTKYPILKMCE